jgi:signal transduction histidine kinase
VSTISAVVEKLELRPSGVAVNAEEISRLGILVSELKKIAVAGDSSLRGVLSGLTLNLYPIVAEVLARRKRDFESAGITTALHDEEGDAIIFGDKAAVYRMVDILLANVLTRAFGVEQRERSCAVILTRNHNNGYVRLVVQDNGAGISRGWREGLRPGNGLHTLGRMAEVFCPSWDVLEPAHGTEVYIDFYYTEG